MSSVPVFHQAPPKRKRSRSPSPGDNDIPPSSRRRSASPGSRPPIDLPRVQDVDPVRRAERERQLAARLAAVELEKLDKPKDSDADKDKEFDAKAEFAKLISSRSGGVYLPPARVRAMQEAAAANKSSIEYQRLSWDALKKSLTGIVNRVNVTNIKDVVPELFSENLIRGRGLFARSLMKAQAASLPFTPVFACLVAIINTKLPQVGELVLNRLISQFRKAFKRNNKSVCLSSSTFIAHLVNQGVADCIVALEMLVLLTERPTDDSIETAVGFMREVGAFLSENEKNAANVVFERFRAVLNEGSISHRVQYMIEVLMQVRKDKFKDNPILAEGLDLVEEEEQITHRVKLDDTLEIQEGLNIFKFDPKFLENEEKYKEIKEEILGEGSDEEESGSEESSDDSDDEGVVEEKEGIEDHTQTNLVNLRRTIYLTIMNALNYEEAVHKLLKIQLQEGQEIELVNMIIECCSQERSYSTFYGLVGERFSKLNRVWTDCFEMAFTNYYETIHRYETNRLRNISRFFGHLLASDSISWVVLRCVRMNEDETTSSSRIFVKILLQDIRGEMGLKELGERFKDPEVKAATHAMFPMDNPKNTRFAINYFTSIELGLLTEEMREYLKNAPRLIMEQRRAMLEQESSDSDSSSSDDSSSDSDTTSSSSGSDSEDSRRAPRRRYTKSPVRRSSPPRRGRNESRSPSPPRRTGRGKAPTPSPPPQRNRGQRRFDSRSPPRRREPPPPPRSPSPPVRRRRDDSRSPRRRADVSPRRPARDVSMSPPRRPTGREEAKRVDSRSGPDYAGRKSNGYNKGGRSPPRRPRHDSDTSRTPPPRRARYDSDVSRTPSPPPRTRQRRNSPSPPRNGRRSPDYRKGRMDAESRDDRNGRERGGYSNDRDRERGGRR